VTREDILAVIVQNAQEVLPQLVTHTFQPTDALKDLGANSMDRAEILMMTLESLNLNLPTVAFHGAENIGGLADEILQKSRGL